MSFSEDDKMGTIQPYGDALVVILRIGGYDVKRVMVDQGSGAEIMYPDLYKGLNLKLENLTAYDSPLVSFDGKVVTPRGQIRLPVQVGLEVVEVDFIVVDAYSPYMAIVARPWLHALGAVSSTLHLKVKYPSGDEIEELVGSQSMAQQCLVATIMHQPAAKSSASTERGLQQSKSLVLPVDGPAEEVKCEDLEKIVVGDDLEKFFQVGAQLLPQEKEELVEFSRGTLMCSYGMLTKLRGWIRASSVII